MKNGTARLLRGILKLVITLGIPAFIVGSWIFKQHYSVGEMIKAYFLLIQMLLGAAVGATLIHNISGVKSPSLLLLAETAAGAFVGGLLCRLVFGLIARIIFKLGVIIAGIVCAALILFSFAASAMTVMHLREDRIKRAEEIIHKSQSGNVKEELRQFRSSVGSGNTESALDEAARRVGHGIK